MALARMAGRPVPATQRPGGVALQAHGGIRQGEGEVKPVGSRRAAAPQPRPGLRGTASGHRGSRTRAPWCRRSSGWSDPRRRSARHRPIPGVVERAGHDVQGVIAFVQKYNARAALDAKSAFGECARWIVFDRSPFSGKREHRLRSVALAIVQSTQATGRALIRTVSSKSAPSDGMHDPLWPLAHPCVAGTRRCRRSARQTVIALPARRSYGLGCWRTVAAVAPKVAADGQRRYQ